jgi:hypothetical protein
VDCVFVVCVVVEVGGGGIVGDVVVSVVDVVVGGGDPPHPANKAKVPITAAPAALVHGRMFGVAAGWGGRLAQRVCCHPAIGGRQRPVITGPETGGAKHLQ